jgi:hypothetical protein
VHWCFKGDPSFRNTPGCFDGSMTCSELGQWGPCTGGVHATDHCFANSSSCHAITAIPGGKVDLKAGTGNFSANAVPGSESFTVECPMGVSQCPAVVPPQFFSEIQSGEYTVTYAKTVAGDPSPQSCTFPLFIGDRGLRIELSWEHFNSDDGVDLDLHVHQPSCAGAGEACGKGGDCCAGACNAGVCGPLGCKANGATCTLPGQCCSGLCVAGACAGAPVPPWAISPGRPQDCTWSSCKIDQVQFNDMVVPNWFPAGAQPDPCGWDIQTSPLSLDNTCYNDPRGVGADWQSLAKGCHNPRLDIDNIQCNFTVTDPTDPDWCGPENVNVDYPPLGQWFRMGVHYYYNHGRGYDVHPEIKIFCNGALSADLGPHSFYVPESPVTFEPGDGDGTGSGNRFWLAADVAFVEDMCGNVSCVVQPLYDDPTSKTPLFTLDTTATATFSPAWPPAPK